MALRSQCCFSQGHPEHNMLQKLVITTGDAGGRRTGWWRTSDKQISVFFIHHWFSIKEIPSCNFRFGSCPLFKRWLAWTVSQPWDFLVQKGSAKLELGQNWLVLSWEVWLLHCSLLCWQKPTAGREMDAPACFYPGWGTDQRTGKKSGPPVLPKHWVSDSPYTKEGHLRHPPWGPKSTSPNLLGTMQLCMDISCMKPDPDPSNLQRF